MVQKRLTAMWIADYLLSVGWFTMCWCYWTTCCIGVWFRTSECWRTVTIVTRFWSNYRWQFVKVNTSLQWLTILLRTTNLYVL